MKSRRAILVTGVLAAIGLIGCSGGGAKTEVQTTTTTKGQQLIDLKEAYDQGVITEAEYEKQKKKILNQ